MALSPSQYAKNLRFQLSLSGPVDVMAVAHTLSVPVYEEELDRFEGCLIWVGGNARILVRASIPYETRKNFTIAHEFGHFYMPHHKRNTFSCTAEDIARYCGDSVYENEANEFAAEFLLPRSELEKQLMSTPDIAVIREISAQYGTSLTSTAIRVVETTCEPVAVVLSEASKVRWVVRSRSFPFRVKRGALHEWTYAIDYFSGKEFPGDPQHVVATAWCDGVSRENLLIEESVAFGRLGMVMTLLRVPADDDVCGNRW